MTTAQEKVELEQVPLKSDIDPPPGTETEQMTKVENEPIKKKCTKWFCKKSKNGEVTTTEITTTDEKKKVCKWWNKNAHKENVDDEKQMTVGINMLDRDEKVWSFAVHRVFDPLMSSCGLCCAGFANRKSEMHDSPTVLA
ncbi:unnamed protein product [Anisakis simplex]|uniref:DUF4379 domain-containing protein n=1 Tax=Anisakis simplex TaxID=6269 RepID=A0A0M3K2E9_ANISI|nr:unnamed protein product [Anisakis simplex]